MSTVQTYNETLQMQLLNTNAYLQVNNCNSTIHLFIYDSIILLYKCSPTIQFKTKCIVTNNDTSLQSQYYNTTLKYNSTNAIQ